MVSKVIFFYLYSYISPIYYKHFQLSDQKLYLKVYQLKNTCKEEEEEEGIEKLETYNFIHQLKDLKNPIDKINVFIKLINEYKMNNKQTLTADHMLTFLSSILLIK